MKLAVSNIAWTNEEEEDVARLLQELEVRFVEIAPTKKWDNPTSISDEEVEHYKAFWRRYGIEVVAFQSMLFNRPDLKFFESEVNRAETTEYLKDFIGLAGRFGAKAMVFGSPKNRQRGDMRVEQATDIAKGIFGQLGDVAQENGVRFCIEPNAPQYACDFITTAHEGIELVQEVNNSGFGLHLDIACMTLAGDDVAESIKAASEALEHFHISSPMLEQVEDRDDVRHRAAAEALRSINYDKFVSIEMRPGAPGENVDRVRNAVNFAKSVYSS